jgi:predicted dehydrogenase
MFHLKALERLEEIIVTAVSDINPERMEQVRNECGATSSYINYKQLIEDKKVDAIAVNTPPMFHERMVIDSLKNGKHVICEKPLSQTVQGCKKIKELKKKTNLSVLPAHNYSFSPSIFKMEQVIAEGEIGRITSLTLSFENHLRSYRSQTNFRESFEHGVIEDVLPHVLSVTIPLIGTAKSVDKVNSWRKNYNVCDNVQIEFFSESDIPVSTSLSWTKLRPKFSVIVKGEKGTLYSDLMLAPYKLKMIMDGKTETIKEKGVSWYFDLVRLKHPSFLNQYYHFHQIIEGNSSPRITIDDEINIVETVAQVSSFLES